MKAKNPKHKESLSEGIKFALKAKSEMRPAKEFIFEYNYILECY
jgi:hypothetical protein